MTVDMMITANKSLTPVGSFENVKDLTLPNIYPLNPIIYFPEEHIYEQEHLYRKYLILIELNKKFF